MAVRKMVHADDHMIGHAYLLFSGEKEDPIVCFMVGKMGVILASVFGIGRYGRLRN
jgi:hypothetical protein